MKSVITFIIILFVSLSAQDVKETKKIGFDTTANPAMDLKTAIVQAKKEKKNIILDVGGEWCIWCHRLHEFIEANNNIKTLLEKNYVVVKVNFSKGNKNEAFLKDYPKIPGYPHLFVLNRSGKLLHSQDTGLLEKEKSYDAQKLMSFLKKWAKKK